MRFKEIFHKHHRKPATVAEHAIGIEIEAEFKSREVLDHMKIEGFNIHNDNSLMNYGYEFVTTPTESEEALKRVRRLLADPYFTKHYIPSPRTSTHVHFNMLERTVEEILVIIVTYYILEKILMGFCDRSRQSNLFCLTLRDSGDIRILELMLSGNWPAFFNGSLLDGNKYSACNLAALSTLGTLEFRALQGTKDYMQIRSWVTVLEQICRSYQRYSTIQEVWESFLEDRTKFVKDNIGFIPVNLTTGSSIDVFMTTEYNFSNILQILDLPRHISANNKPKYKFFSEEELDNYEFLMANRRDFDISQLT